MAATQIHGIQDRDQATLRREIEQGGKFVVFSYTISILIMTFKRSTDVYYIPPGAWTLKYAAIPTIGTFFFGWWGIPWGPIYTLMSIFGNLMGGKNITQDVLALEPEAERIYLEYDKERPNG